MCLGDGICESNLCMFEVIDDFYRYSGDLFTADEVDVELLKDGIFVDMNKVC